MKIIEKPWGKEEMLEMNEHYMVKKLTMLKGHRCSLQYHSKKRETIYVLSGSLKILSGTNQESLSAKVFTAHESLTLVPGVVHRMEAEEDSVYLEASTPETEDVIRLKDDYSRVKNGL